jgi:hypothetical protein
LLKAVYDPPGLEVDEGLLWSADKTRGHKLAKNVRNGVGSAKAEVDSPEEGVVGVSNALLLESPTKMRACLALIEATTADIVQQGHADARQDESSSQTSAPMLTGTAAAAQPVLQGGMTNSNGGEPEPQAAVAPAALRPPARLLGKAYDSTCQEGATSASCRTTAEEDKKEENEALLARGSHQASDPVDRQVVNLALAGSQKTPPGADGEAAVQKAWFPSSAEPEQVDDACSTAANPGSLGVPSGSGGSAVADAGCGNRGSKLCDLLAKPLVLVFLWQSMVMGLGLGAIGNFLFLHVEAMGGGEMLMGLMLAVRPGHTLDRGMVFSFSSKEKGMQKLELHAGLLLTCLLSNTGMQAGLAECRNADRTCVAYFNIRYSIQSMQQHRA